MMVTASFYGVAQSNIVKDILASLFISLCGTVTGTVPSTIIRNCFVKAKPATIKTAKKKTQTETDTDTETTHHERLNTDWVKDYMKKDRESLCVAQFHQNLSELVEQKG
eukprot:898709_1